MIGDPALARAIERFVPSTELLAVFAADPFAGWDHDRLGGYRLRGHVAWVYAAAAPAAAMFFLVFRITEAARPALALSAVAAVLGTIAARVCAPPRVVVAVLARHVVVTEMDRLRPWRARRVRANLSRTEATLVARRTSPGRNQELRVGGVSYLARGESVEVVRQVASAPR